MPVPRGPKRKKLLAWGGLTNLGYIIPIYIYIWNCQVQNVSDLIPFLLIQLRQSIMILFIFGDGFVEVAHLLIGPGQRVFEKRRQINQEELGIRGFFSAAAAI